MPSEIYFTDKMQREIYEQVVGKNTKWLHEAVAYVRRTRKQYPPDDPRWTDQVVVDHILYYVNVANAIQKDATLDDRNVLVGIRQWLDNNPHPLPPKDEVIDVGAKINEVMGEAIAAKLDDEIVSEPEPSPEPSPEPPAPPEPSPEPSPTPPTKKVGKKKASKKKVSKKKVSKKKTTKKRSKK